MTEHPIPEDLRELYDSTAEWDGSLMVRFANAHGVIPWQTSADYDLRRYFIERIAALEDLNMSLTSTHNTHVIMCSHLNIDNAHLKAQVATLSKPVSDEEWIEHRAIPSYANPAGTMYRHEINDLIAARLAAAQKSMEH